MADGNAFLLNEHIPIQVCELTTFSESGSSKCSKLIVHEKLTVPVCSFADSGHLLPCSGRKVGNRLCLPEGSYSKAPLLADLMCSSKPTGLSQGWQSVDLRP